MGAHRNVCAIFSTSVFGAQRLYPANIRARSKRFAGHSQQHCQCSEYLVNSSAVCTWAVRRIYSALLLIMMQRISCKQCSRVMLSRQCMYWPCQRGCLFGELITYSPAKREVPGSTRPAGTVSHCYNGRCNKGLWVEMTGERCAVLNSLYWQIKVGRVSDPVITHTYYRHILIIDTYLP